MTGARKRFVIAQAPNRWRCEQISIAISGSGPRLWGRTQQQEYNDEFAFQFGSFRSDDIRPSAASTEHGYRIESKPLRPKCALRALAVSGDENPSSHTVGTFMFEKVHISATQNCSPGAI